MLWFSDPTQKIFLAAQNIFTENANIKAGLLFCQIKVDAFPERLALAKDASNPLMNACAETDAAAFSHSGSEPSVGAANDDFSDTV